MSGFAVYHTSKGKGSGGGLGNHIDRVPGKEHSYKNADPKRKNLNKEYIGDYKHLTLPQAIAKRIEEGYNGKRKIRTDAVKYLTHIFSGSHNEMKEIFASAEKRKEWLQMNYLFASKQFGKENIIRFSLHMDEKTPHIHCVTVPLTSDGRLSAKEIIGNKKDMEQRQDLYATMMQQVHKGLKRGIKSGRKHETAQEYRARLNIVNKFDAEIKPVKSLLGIDKGKTLELAEERLKEAKNIINGQQARIYQLQKDFENEAKYKNKYQDENLSLRVENKNKHNLLVNVLNYEDELKRIREVNKITPKKEKPKKKQQVVVKTPKRKRKGRGI